MRRPRNWRRIYYLAAVFALYVPMYLFLYGRHEGQFLVATGKFRGGTPFADTVVYLSEHALFDGAQGVILNRPLSSAGKVPEDILKAYGDSGLPLYYGGPVRFPSHVFALYAEKDGLRLENIRSPADIPQDRDRRPVKLFFGFSGWGPAQLNLETVMGYWGAIDADPGLAASGKPENIYPAALHRLLTKHPVRRNPVF